MRRPQRRTNTINLDSSDEEINPTQDLETDVTQTESGEIERIFQEIEVLSEHRCFVEEKRQNLEKTQNFETK